MTFNDEKSQPDHGVWRLVFVDPQLAEKMLRERAANRAINIRRVHAYSRQMVQQTWTLTHQGLSVTCDGRINDGQHRLAAVVECGLGQWFWVYTEPGVATGMAHFDRHQERTTLQSLTLSGLPATQQLVAVSRSILADGNYMACKSLFSDEEVWKCVELNTSRIELVGKSLGKAKCYGGATFIAACVRALHAWEDDPAVLRFVEVVHTGVADGEAESAAIRYRDWAAVNSQGGGVTARHNVYWRAVSALIAFRARRVLKKLYVSSHDPFVGCGIPSATAVESAT